MKATAPLLALASLAVLAACDPYHAPGTWRPTGDNDRNLRAMIADPRDLVTGGAGSEVARGNAASTPVLDLLAGKRRKLGNISTGASTGSGSGEGGDAAAGQP